MKRQHTMKIKIDKKDNRKNINIITALNEQHIPNGLISEIIGSPFTALSNAKLYEHRGSNEHFNTNEKERLKIAEGYLKEWCGQYRKKLGISQAITDSEILDLLVKYRYSTVKFLNRFVVASSLNIEPDEYMKNPHYSGAAEVKLYETRNFLNAIKKGEVKIKIKKNTDFDKVKYDLFLKVINDII